MSELCHIRNEVDLSEWTGTVVDLGDLSVHADAAMGDSAKGLKLEIDDQTEIYGWKTISGALTQLRIRFYLDTNGITIGDGDSWPILNWYNSDGKILALIKLGFAVATGYRLVGGFVDDEENWDLWTNWNTISDVVHYIELHVIAESGDGNNDGTAELWVDGVSVDTVANMDNWAMFGAGSRDVYFGALWSVPASGDGIYYLDELRANNDGGLIGPVRQPMMLRATTVPHMRQWQPGVTR